jgi:predicted ATPase
MTVADKIRSSSILGTPGSGKENLFRALALGTARVVSVFYIITLVAHTNQIKKPSTWLQMIYIDYYVISYHITFCSRSL